MARKHIEEKHKAIKSEYNELHAKGYRHEVIAERLAKKYFMAKVSVENLVWETAGYGKKKKKEDPNQIRMFD